MFKRAKLRGPIGGIYPIFFFSAAVFAVGEIFIRRELILHGMDINWGPLLITIISSLFVTIMGIYQWWRYHLWIYFGLGLVAGSSTLQSMCQYTDFFTIQSYIANIMLVIIFIIVTWRILAGQERFEIKARRLFKLAADSIEETDAGFTARPYSAGKAEFTTEELVSFARYLKSKHIVSPVHRKEGIFMCFSLGRSLMLNPDPSLVSYVLFGNEGDISVHIAAFDYKQYTKRFSFDQLCSSLGSTMHRFLEHYKDGNEGRIIDELKSV
ncbi:MAG: hypothetical protein DRJ15_15530 [Bacteroidetes bacterium]|nr:MAG: hypothetical protein DRJ15_15530 [Bacteroidota bacterium]